MANVDHDLLIATLDWLKLTAIRNQLDTLLDDAARSKMNLREALAFLVSREIARRDERRISMSSKLAQFPFVRDLDGFALRHSHRSIRARSENLRHAAGLLMEIRSCSSGPLERARPIWPSASGVKRSARITTCSSSPRRRSWQCLRRLTATAPSTSS